VQDEIRFPECFSEMFRVEVADTEHLRREAFRLRYRVYCEERNFERREHFPDQLESDTADAHSIHALVRHRQSGTPVGVVRLILRHSGKSDGLLPVERTCRGIFDQEEIAKFSFQNSSVAEVSRFAVSKGAIAEVEKHIAASASGSREVRDSGAELARNPLQNIVLGLIAALFQMSEKHDIDHWYALMEPSLARHLSRLGLRFTRVGPLVNHRGKRQPMLASLTQLRQDIKVQNRQLHALIEAGGQPVPQRPHHAADLGRPQRAFGMPPLHPAMASRSA
jgi:N-acyl amino acid synthase of PEP-CTERM/exosortase system